MTLTISDTNSQFALLSNAGMNEKLLSPILQGKSTAISRTTLEHVYL